jgi:hypothetical protein
MHVKVVCAGSKPQVVAGGICFAVKSMETM